MDSLMFWGVSVIQVIQLQFGRWSNLMMFLSYVGDPRFAFIIYFPLAYVLHRSVGIRVMWVAVISEWLNAVLKWLLHGERPYWWVHSPGIYSEEKTPHLHQFNITCETGPGSPSGHAMVTSAVLYVLVSDFLRNQQIQSLWSKVSCWAFYISVMTAVCVSRLFIATHFPHQVIAGTFSGIIVAKAVNAAPISSLQPSKYATVSVLLTVAAAATYGVLQLAGVDPLWSVSLAIKWCAYREWIHLDTTLFYALVRDIASLMGLGFSVWLQPMSSMIDKPRPFLVKAVLSAAAFMVTFTSETLKPSATNALVFYAIAFIKHCVTVMAVVIGIDFVSIRLGFTSRYKEGKTDVTRS